MKNLIVTSIVAVVGLSMLSLSHEHSPAKQQHITISGSKQTTSSMNNGALWCPVNGDGFQIPRPGDSLLRKEEVTNYRHCEKCSTGAFLPSREGVSRCSFCGELEASVN